MVSASRDDGPPLVSPTPAPISEQACLALEAAAAAAGWLVLVAVRSPALVLRLQATGTPLLLIEPNAAQAARLSVWLESAGPVAFSLCGELPGSGGGAVLWHHYNDPRWDGLRPPEGLLPSHPNLRLSHTSRRPTAALEALLECWEHGPIARGAQGMLLVEEASLPAVLAGAGSILPLLSWVGWLLPEPVAGAEGVTRSEAVAGIEIPMEPPLAVSPSLWLPHPVAGDGRLLQYQACAPAPAAADQASHLRRENLALRHRIAQLRQLVLAGEERLRALEAQRPASATRPVGGG